MKNIQMWMCMFISILWMWGNPTWAQEVSDPSSAPDVKTTPIVETNQPANEEPTVTAVSVKEESNVTAAPGKKESNIPVTPEKEEPKTAETKDKIKDPLKFKGDLRYRHEAIKKGDKKMDHRHRIRMRFGAFSEIAETLELGFQIASGGGDPISTNQTLTPAFTKKPMTIDLAYFQYKVAGFAIVGGKMKNPLFRPGDSQLIWDSDLTPEGITAAYEITTDTFKLSALGLALWNADRKDDEKDSYILGGQARAHAKFDDFTLCAAGGFYNFSKIKGYAALYENKAFGNTLDANELYVNDYNIVDAGLEVKGKLGSLPFSIFGQLAFNMATDEEKTGFLAGFSIGETKKSMGWKLGYNFRSLQKDAVFGTYTDSDFIGASTGGTGHVVSAEFALTDKLVLGATVQRSTINDGNDTAYTRIQIDASIKL